MTSGISSWKLSLILVTCAVLLLSACAEVRLGTMPTPSPSPRLRVFIVTVSGKQPPKGWLIPDAQFRRLQLRSIAGFLQDSGIYEVIPEKDVRTVLGSREIQDWQWERNDLALVKSVGRAVHADYAIISIRNVVRGRDYESRVVCLNLETGVQYADSYYIDHSSVGPREAMYRNKRAFGRQYRKLFRDLKTDLLVTAVRKGRSVPADGLKKTRDIEKPVETKEEGTKPAPPAIPIPPTEPLPAAEPSAGLAARVPLEMEEDDVSHEGAVEKIPVSPETKSGGQAPSGGKSLGKERTAAKGPEKTRLVVYDFEAVGQLNVVALILSEALREELFSLGRFTLVNREHIVQALKEINLQQSGLVDEKQAVQMGKWLAASETVSGRLAVLGNSYILQAKRTDMSTLGTLGLGLLKCEAGREEELLSGMPELARKLVGGKR